MRPPQDNSEMENIECPWPNFVVAVQENPGNPSHLVQEKIAQTTGFHLSAATSRDRRIETSVPHNNTQRGDEEVDRLESVDGAQYVGILVRVRITDFGWLSDSSHNININTAPTANTVFRLVTVHTTRTDHGVR